MEIEPALDSFSPRPTTRTHPGQRSFLEQAPAFFKSSEVGPATGARAFIRFVI